MNKMHKHGLWAFIVGLIGACGAGLFIWFISTFATGRIGNPIGWLFVQLPVGSTAVAFRWQLIGGVLLVLEGLSLTGAFGPTGGKFFRPFSTGIPTTFILMGIIFNTFYR
jgi:hypothetical protein